MPAPIDRDRVALGIQQPWAELILRGVKTIEVRTRRTRHRGTIYLYAGKRAAIHPAAQDAARRGAVLIESLPAGALVGTVEIVDSRPARRDDAAAACLPPSLLRGRFAWELADPRRFEEPVQVRFLPYGVWFYPFRRRSLASRRRRAQD
jgi:hypothetical protein